MGNKIAKTLLSYENNSRPIYKIVGRYNAKVVDVYDGDTITVSIINNFTIQKHKLRMLGYDSPEMKPRLNIPNRAEEIEKAKQAKNFLNNLILNKVVLADINGFDKYGRLLGTIFYDTKNINQVMLDNGHGYVYNGGTKRKAID
jgi:endonuclease YncB( thermonuclease family)